MGEHILRRGQPTGPSELSERRSTAKIPEQQLHELIHDPTYDDLEAELELVEAYPEVLPDSTPIPLPSASSQRLAHTMRRGAHAATAAQPVSPAERTKVRPIGAARAETPARAARVMTCVSLPSLLPPDSEQRLLTEIRKLPIENEAPSAAASPIRTVLRSAGRARAVLPLVLLVLALGAAAFWLL